MTSSASERNRAGGSSQESCFYFTPVLPPLPRVKFTRYAITLLPAVILLQAIAIYFLVAAAKSYLEKLRPGLGPAGRASLPAYAFVAVILCITAGWELYMDTLNEPYPS